MKFEPMYEGHSVHLSIDKRVILMLCDMSTHSRVVADSDYVAGPLQATFSTSSVEGSISCVDIGILQDLALESDHSFGVEVISATPSVVVVGTPSEETVTILDDESM